jgi:wobble nucleotide-excising tRNase
MLKKITEITRVGRFISYTAARVGQYGKLTLLFGENAKGKTTLTAILRSAQTGDANLINARTSLPVTGLPAVKVVHDGGMAEFQGGGWNTPIADIEIFDAQFIDDNVCSGLSVDHDHKRNLYRVIVGETGVVLSRKVDDIDRGIRAVNTRLNEKKAEIKQHVADGLDIDNFIGLAKSETIDDLITRKEDEITALKSAAEIASKGSFAEIRLAAGPTTAILARTLEDLSKEAADAVAAHTKTLGSGGETWLEQGAGYMKDTCPFCTQPLEGVELVASYQAYFSEAYYDLKQEIRQHLKGAGDNFGPDTVISTQNTFNGNSTLTEFWKRFFDVKLGSLDLVELMQGIRELHTRLIESITAKSGSPLEDIPVGAELQAAITAYAEFAAKVTEYNTACRAMNEEVKTVKARAKAGNLATAEKELALLKNTKNRHDPAVATLCNEYRVLQLQKLTLEKEKLEAKDALDTHSGTIFGLYETSMNAHLTLFGADFRMVNTSGNYQGGKPNSTYSIAINACPVDVDAKDGKPSFKCTLSGGDKSCLALSFFLARLDHDPRLKEKVIVLDDPMCSMDRDRSDRTVKVILELASKAKQVIVMSHDPHFLRRLWDSTAPADRKALCVRRVGEAESTIEEWEIVDATRSEYLQDYFALAKFVAEGSGDLRDVARKIRPLLEENLRMRFPDLFGSTEWLGDFIDKIRNANPGDPAFAMKTHLTELAELNDFSKRYHHATNPAASREPITDGALKTYAIRTLKFLRGEP